MSKSGLKGVAVFWSVAALVAAWAVLIGIYGIFVFVIPLGLALFIFMTIAVYHESK